jgi:GDPmannose 4,6-dehydratase
VKLALVTGACGQDGSYLCELLLGEGYRVVGTALDPRAERELLPPAARDRVELLPLDLRDPEAIARTVAGVAPAELYNCAGLSSGAGMHDDPAGQALVNGVAVTHLLEAARRLASPARVCQASSSELFGDPVESPQTEATALRPRSPYGAAKLYAHAMVRIARERHGLFACSAILFNHESPRRAAHFVTRKVTRAAAAIRLGQARELRLGSLAARRDWGFAGDTVRALWLMLQAAAPDDYVVATGEAHSVAELCELAFGHVGLDYRDHVLVDSSEVREPERCQLVGDASRARARLGWAPRVGFRELVGMMVDADLAALRGGAGAR